MAEVTLPQPLSRTTHRVPKLRDVCAVFQFIHSRSFDASGQNPVSRTAGWGPQGAATEFPEGSNSRCSATPECGPRSRIQILKRALRVRRVDQNTDSKFQGRVRAHLQVRENTSGGVSTRRLKNTEGGSSRWRVGLTITLVPRRIAPTRHQRARKGPKCRALSTEEPRESFAK
eukprot:278217-Prymnesium_polylepis.1